MKTIGKYWIAAFIVLLALATAKPATAGPFPGSCQDVRNSNPSAVDGDYLIYPAIGGGLNRVFQIYCRDMAGTPKEYLTLGRTGGPPSNPFRFTDEILAADPNFFQNSFNYSTDENGGNAGLMTKWYKVRFDLASLQIITDDFTFSQTSSWYNTPTFPIPYGVAGACQSGWELGHGNVDLTGTSFKVSDTYTLNGTASTRGWVNPPQPMTRNGAQVSVFVSGVIVHIMGGGSCGDNGPINRSRLKVEYTGAILDFNSLVGPQGPAGPTGAKGDK
jgi:hypothetical protein